MALWESYPFGAMPVGTVFTHRNFHRAVFVKIVMIHDSNTIRCDTAQLFFFSAEEKCYPFGIQTPNDKPKDQPNGKPQHQR